MGPFVNQFISFSSYEIEDMCAALILTSDLRTLPLINDKKPTTVRLSIYQCKKNDVLSLRYYAQALAPCCERESC